MRNGKSWETTGKRSKKGNATRRRKKNEARKGKK
jgi:hypothetical protein